MEPTYVEPAASQGNDPQDVNLSAVEKLVTTKSSNLRVTALNNLRAQKMGGDMPEAASPLISARYQNQSNQTSPVRSKASSQCSLDNHLNDTHSQQGTLTRQNSGSLSLDGGRRKSRSRSPSKLSQGPQMSLNESDAPSGLDFLLQACDLLEPEENNSGRTSKRPARRQGSQRPRRYSDEEYAPGDTSEDDEYRPSRNRGGPRRTSQASQVTARASTGNSSGAASGGAAPPIRWERGMVHGPCTNPDCEHPEDSPQWRKGPPTNPVLCNACGTRWLRNGTLKPLVPRRGIRYNKVRGRTTSRSRSAPMHEMYSEPAMGSQDVSQDEDMDMGRVASAPAPRHIEHREEPVQVPEAPQQPATNLVNDPIAAATSISLLAPAVSALQNSPFFQPLIAGSTLEQQLAAVTAAAQAAQQALVAAAAAQVAQQQQQLYMQPAQPVTLKTASPLPLPAKEPAAAAAAARPVFNITAVAGPTALAPRYMEYIGLQSAEQSVNIDMPKVEACAMQIDA